jgi:hypothetical protein
VYTGCAIEGVCGAGGPERPMDSGAVQHRVVREGEKGGDSQVGGIL